jgi:molybdate transport system regulatory protein
MKVAWRVWLEKDGEHLLGKGGAEILSAIKEYGSISKAAEKLGMSYRYVWNYLKRMEEVLGTKVVDARRGGAKGGRAELTEFGERVLRQYRRIEKYIEDVGRDYDSFWEAIGLKISARNKIEGVVRKIEVDGIAAKVEIEVSQPCVIKAVITKEAAEELELREGEKVYAVIKATEVMVARE